MPASPPTSIGYEKAYHAAPSGISAFAAPSPANVICAHGEIVPTPVGAALLPVAGSAAAAGAGGVSRRSASTHSGGPVRSNWPSPGWSVESC